ncbi:hypothetical protein Pcinc_030811 [Petrolisthes cinctipes]|uniref:Uncharacterized protein n=1 Tax=Petrolisthes cinctipes TaxID=88211 RepID=A0AAE1EXY6_PETCI|nr:hypothetical protein Pcinc_030811 [Petrolisthes cinctipes]
MWPSNSGQGCVVEACVGAAPPSGACMNSAREEGARPKVLSPSTDSKLRYDSNNDSGFLSDSNLLSSSSVSCEDPGTTTSMRCEDIMPGETHHHSDPKTQQMGISATRLDSGIDISEQLSSLHLASPSVSSISTTSETGETEDSPSRRPVSPPSRRSRLGLSEAQVSLLQEIFQRDEDGDTQLHVAVMRGFIEVVYHITRLLPHQAFLDLANHAGKVSSLSGVFCSQCE